MAVERKLSDELTDPYALRDGLLFLEKMQRLVSSQVPDTIYRDGEVPSNENISHYTLATIVELIEMMNEMPWKKWSHTDRHNVAHTQRICDEFADVLAFIGILLSYVRAFGVTPEKIAESYIKTSENNYKTLAKNKR